MIKVALLTTDSREHFKDYANPNPFFGTAPEALIEGFKLLPEEVEVHVLSCLQKGPISSPLKLADNVHYHALRVSNLGWLKTGYQGCIRAVRRKLREIQPDIVHGQGTERDCAMCAVHSGYPNVLTIHGNMRLVAKVLGARPFTYYWFASILERHCLRRTGGVVAISQYTQTNVDQFAQRSWLLANAVHPSFFDVERHPDTPPRVLCVANVGTRKNQAGLIKALDALAGKVPMKLVFAGAGNESDEYLRQFKEMLRSRPWCEYLGAVDKTTLQREMSRATAAVLPTFEDNCPMVILEAAAARIPVAASAVGGIPDLIEDGESGLLFDPHDCRAIGRAVHTLLHERTTADKLAQKAHELRILQNSPASVARQHLVIYRELVALH
jgi:glycosyltransferase involved in cell wall biosynthesis